MVPGGCGYAASAASAERQVSLWQVPPGRKSKKQHAAAGSLVLDEPAVQLDAATCSGADGQQGAFLVAAVSEAGQAYVWRCQGGEEGVDARLLLNVRVGSGTRSR